MISNLHARGWVEIDPNVRINGDHTFTYLTDDDPPADWFEVGSAYVVGESEANICWPATLVRMTPDGFMEFDVAWTKGKFL